MASPFICERLLAAVLICGCVGGCNVGTRCGETVLQTVASPDGTVAKIYVVNCGATTDYFTYVNIRRADLKFRDDGMLFGYRGKINLHLAWVEPHQLQIICAACDNQKVYREVTKEGAYTIRYIGLAAN
jgi:hypothetical protein